MNVLAVTVGIAIVLGIAMDMALTVLHPTIRGAFSHRLTRGLWRMIRALSVATGSRRMLTFAGPLATVALFVAWLGGLWLGFGLVYLPFVDHVLLDGSLRPPRHLHGALCQRKRPHYLGTG